MEENKKTKEELNDVLRELKENEEKEISEEFKVVKEEENKDNEKRKKNKKTKKIVLIILLMLIIGLIINKNHYVLITDYQGEYDIQYTNLTDFLVNGKTTDGFTVQEVMTYNEYIDYCTKWNLEINYSNENLNYIVYSEYENGTVHIRARLGDVTYTEETATIYVWRAGSGDTVDMAAYIIIIPVEDTCITKVETNYVATLGNILTYIIYRYRIHNNLYYSFCTCNLYSFINNFHNFINI